jgi:catechol 2,3-dioxygenase-like lactoylglutathione lyase family enzyme
MNAAAAYATELRSAPRRPGPSVAHLPVRSLLRSINFFSTVLGYEVVRDGRREPWPHVVMAARGCSPVVLHSRRESARTQDAAASAALIVADLEQVRARAWDAGVTITRGHFASARIVENGQPRSLYVRDPDGHELDLTAATMGSS